MAAELVRAGRRGLDRMLGPPQSRWRGAERWLEVRMRILVLAVAVAGCTVPQPRIGPQDELASYTAGRVAGAPQRCIPVTSRVEGLRAVDGQTVVYKSGLTNWVNRLQHECPGLRPLGTLVVDTVSSQYCRGDRVRPFEAGANTARAVCALGDFVPYRRGG